MATQGHSWGEEGFGGDNGASLQHSDQQVDFDPESHLSGDIPDNGSDDDGADYDPESVTLDTPVAVQIPERQPSTQTQRSSVATKPKVSGGFLVEASDDEDEDEDEDDDEDDSAKKADKPPAPANPQAHSSTAQPTDPNGQTTSPAPTGMPGMAGLNPITVLEARINDDPRGDMDAWLNLIADHKRNNRLDDLRSTYTRFLEVFPQAVSAITPTIFEAVLTISRPIYGQSGSRWSLQPITLSTRKVSLGDAS